ncbi:JAB domain-containing protein [Niabella terrae]
MTEKFKVPKISLKLTIEAGEQVPILSSKEAYEVLKQMYDEDTVLWQEETILLCISNSSHLIGWYRLSKGGMTGTVVDVRMVYTIALNTPGTTGIMISHNHPSGNLQPSTADRNITKLIKEAGDILQIRLFDHIIYTSDNGYFSFSDAGLL